MLSDIISQLVSNGQPLTHSRACRGLKSMPTSFSRKPHLKNETHNIHMQVLFITLFYRRLIQVGYKNYFIATISMEFFSLTDQEEREIPEQEGIRGVSHHYCLTAQLCASKTNMIGNIRYSPSTLYKS